jgi:hypothetical protein
MSRQGAVIVGIVIIGLTCVTAWPARARHQAISAFCGCVVHWCDQYEAGVILGVEC